MIIICQTTSLNLDHFGHVFSSQLQMKNVSTLSISTLQKNSNNALVFNLDHVYYLQFCFKDLRLS